MPAVRRPSRGGGVTWIIDDAELGGDGLDFGQVPRSLSRAGGVEWRRLGKVFGDNPIRFRECDRNAVAAFCHYAAMFDACAGEVADRGVTIAGRSSADAGRPVKNPAVSLLRDASTQLRYWARELGLTPDSRHRAGIADEPAGRSGGLSDVVGY